MLKRWLQLLVFVSALVSAASVLAAPPLITDDAGTVEPGKVEIELNGSYAYDHEIRDASSVRTNTTDAELKLTTGLLQNLGLSLVMPYTFQARTNENGAVSNIDGFGDMTLEVKYRFVELAGIKLAIKPTLIMPTGSYRKGLSEGRWQYGATLIATKEFDDGKYALHANVGYEHHEYRTAEEKAENRSNLWSGSVAGEAEVLKGLFAVADFGVATNQDKTSNDLPVYALTGLRYELGEHLDIDAGVKFGLTRPEADVTALYGLVLKF